jgi:hypothetical protein
MYLVGILCFILVNVKALYSYNLEEKTSSLSMKYGSTQYMSHIVSNSYVGSGNMVYSHTYSKAFSNFNIKKYKSRHRNKYSTRQYSQKQSQKQSQNLFSIMVQPHRIPEPMFHYPTNKPTITEPVPNLPYDLDDILGQSDV